MSSMSRGFLIMNYFQNLGPSAGKNGGPMTVFPVRNPIISLVINFAYRGFFRSSRYRIENTKDHQPLCFKFAKHPAEDV